MTAAEGNSSIGANATTPPERESPMFSNPFTAVSGNILAAWPDYMIDALQRSVLFLDLLRRRGNEEIEITSRPMATVLSFGHDVLIDGRSLPRPINYTLSRIIPPPGVVTQSAETAGRGGRSASRARAGRRWFQGKK